MTQTIEQLANEVRHLTALIPREQPGRRIAATRDREKIAPALPEMQAIAQYILGDSGCTLEDVQGPSRRGGVVMARWLVMYALRDAGYTVEKIGIFLNHNHTTVVHALKRRPK